MTSFHLLNFWEGKNYNCPVETAQRRNELHKIKVLSYIRTILFELVLCDIKFQKYPVYKHITLIRSTCLRFTLQTFYWHVSVTVGEEGSASLL